MDRKSVQLEMKSAPAHFTARTGLLVVAVFGICSFFLLCNYLLLNQRIGAMEEKLETLQRSERPNPNVSFDDQKGTEQVLHPREKRSVSLSDLEKRLRFLERRYLVLHSSVFFCFSNVEQVTALRLYRYHTLHCPCCFLM